MAADGMQLSAASDRCVRLQVSQLYHELEISVTDVKIWNTIVVDFRVASL